MVAASLTAANLTSPHPTRKLVLTKGKAYVGSCSSEITSGFAMTLRELPHKHSDPPSPTLPLKFAAGCTRTFSIPAKTCFVMTTPPPCPTKYSSRARLQTEQAASTWSLELQRLMPTAQLCTNPHPSTPVPKSPMRKPTTLQQCNTSPAKQVPAHINRPLCNETRAISVGKTRTITRGLQKKLFRADEKIAVRRAERKEATAALQVSWDEPREGGRQKR